MLMLFTGLWGGLIQAVEGFDYLEFAEYLFLHDIQTLREQYAEE
jgi:hypothetical protein